MGGGVGGIQHLTDSTAVGTLGASSGCSAVGCAHNKAIYVFLGDFEVEVEAHQRPARATRHEHALYWETRGHQDWVIATAAMARDSDVCPHELPCRIVEKVAKRVKCIVSTVAEVRQQRFGAANDGVRHRHRRIV